MKIWKKFLMIWAFGIVMVFNAASLFVADATKLNNEDFEIGDLVEVRPTGNPGEPWNPKTTYPAKIIAVKDEERRYQVHILKAVSGSRETWCYSWNVRRAQKEAVDEYTPDFLVGSWNVGPGTSENTVNSRENGDGTRTNTIERGMIGNNNLLQIKGDKTYSWKVSSKETINGSWEESNDPDFPITLLVGYWGENWQAGPDAMHNGKEQIKLRSAVSKKRFWGPRLSGSGTTPAKSPVKTPSRTPTQSNRPSENTQPSPNTRSNSNSSASTTRSWKTGDRVQAQSRDGKWYNGVINETDGNRYQIRYDDNYPYALEWVTAIRPPQ